MYRIDNETSIASLPTPSAAGTNPNSYFTHGNAELGVPATILEADFMNHVQEEICRVIEYTGASLDKANLGQLLTAIKYIQQNNVLSYAASTTAANTYTATLSPAIASYTTGAPIFIKFTHHNTGAATLNLNGLGAKSIKRLDGTALSDSDIVDGQIAMLIYDGTNLQLINPDMTATIAAISSSITTNVATLKTGIQNQSYTYILDTGAANVYVATLSPAVTSYVTGLTLTIKVANTNTGASTINVNGLGAKTIKTMKGLALVGKELVAGTVVTMSYDGTDFKLGYGIRRTAVQVFSATGTYTPNTNMYECIIEAVGGGAGGGGGAASSGVGCGGGGGGGAYSRTLSTTAAIGASQSVTIGAGGAGGTAGNNNGTAGGNTSVGSLCVAVGGSAGVGAAANTQSNSAAGGAAASGTGDFKVSGGDGGPGPGTGLGTVTMPGSIGGSSYFGGGAAPAQTTVAGNNATVYGGGGSGGCSGLSSGARAGGNGKDGYVIITELLLV